MNNRKELTLEIPVNSTRIDEFCKRNDEFNYSKIAYKIFHFLDLELPVIYPEFLKSNRQVEFRCIRELVKNSYDSYALGGLHLNQSLILKVVIQKRKDGVIVKIKDNGSGFLERDGADLFSTTEVICQKKESDSGLLGGQQCGLRLFEKHLNYLGGQLFLKNRKHEGAAIYMVFNDDKEAKCTI